MDPCENCDKLQEVPEGTAPVRIKYNQPTMYDHMSNFSQFQQAKEQDKKCRMVKEKLVSECSKNANIKWNRRDVEEVLKNFSTQQIAEFQKTLKENSDTSEDTSSGGLRLGRSNETLINMSRSPVNCPVTKCTNIIGITSVLSHFVRDHQQRLHVDMQEITGEKRSVLVFTEGAFPNFNENVCLGVLAYAGKTHDEKDRAAVVGLCRPNSFLPEKYNYLVHHLPILIMGCKTSITSLLKDREAAEKYTNPKDSTQHIIVIWLATVETAKTIHCTITAFNKEVMTSRSVITEVRGLKYPQEPKNFISREVNYLKLTRGEINLLSKNSYNEIHLEIFVHEFHE